ncbi:hypothetical protein [Actinomadura rudentiformis]|uniref:Uncharacterized protein n=1 Tax=Actinomadura rudentiformis TaxID=359158 RepID=A0A6H9YSG9_9ACTN|nr:hypothetical protein [Actinomadura rudentiformis]KAB2344829.1 hypothetical protein F8566_30015 [Actinomadura rudentiformis]
MKRPIHSTIPTLPLFDLPQPEETGDVPDREEWWNQAVAGVRELAATGMAFQAYDLVRRGIPEPPSDSQWGALFAALARQRLIVPVGYGPSPRPTTRSSAARIWRGVQR